MQPTESKELPAWLTVAGWISLAGLTASPFLPDLQKEMNTAAGIGLAVLLLSKIYYKKTLLRHSWLFAAVALFIANALLSTVYPAILQDDAFKTIARHSHFFWHTLRAATAAGLCLLLLKQQKSQAMFLALVALILFSLMTWAPIDHWLRGNFYSSALSRADYRLYGSKTNAARFAAVLYMGSYLIWMLLLSPQLLKQSFSRHFKYAGYLVAVLVPLLLLFNKELLDAGPPSGLFPGADPGDRPAVNTSFYILTIAGIAWSAGFWKALSSDGKFRTGALILAMLLLFINMALTTTRVPMGLLLTGSVCAILISLRRWRKPAVAVICLIGVISLVLFLRNPKALEISSIEQRVNIWNGAIEIAEKHPVLGIGYGVKTFDLAFREKYKGHPENVRFKYFKWIGRPKKLHKEPAHAHNQWLEIWVERGVLGLLTFHFLWIGAIVFLILEYRKDKPRPTPAAIAAIFLILLALHGLLEHPVRKSNETLFWVIAAVGIAASRLSPDKEEETP